MRSCAVFLGLCLLIPSIVNAQEEQNTEAGITLCSISSMDEVLRINIPGIGVTGISGIYLSFFPSPQVMMTPRLNIGLASYDGSNSTQLGLDGQIAYLISGQKKSSPYLAANISVLSYSWGSGDSDTESGYGFGAGFRNRIGDAFALRLEARFQKWKDVNETVISFSLGTVF